MTIPEIVTLVTDFAADYAVYIGAGAVVGLLAMGLAKLIRSGR